MKFPINFDISSNSLSLQISATLRLKQKKQEKEYAAETVIFYSLYLYTTYATSEL